jgi:TRAP-type C4-dicarboxylate transport system substrate-binding protein
MRTNFHISRSAVAALMAASVVAAGCGSQSDKAGGSKSQKAAVLTMANGNGDPHELEPFARAVERLSNGTLRLDIRNSWRGGAPSYETGAIGDVRAGKVDLAWAGSRAFHSVGVKSFDPLHAPLLVNSYPLERKVLESDLVPTMLAGLKSLGVVGLGILPGPMRHPLGVKRLVRPEDYQGKTLAIARSKIAEQTFSALGAKAHEIPAQGQITSLDGVEQQVASIAGNGYDNTARFLTSNVDLWPRPLVIFMNKKSYAGLTSRQRAALDGASKAVLGTTLSQAVQDEKEAMSTLCRRGLVAVKASPEDVAELQTAVQPVLDRLEADPRVKSSIERIQSMQTDAPTDPAPASGCTGGTTGAATAAKSTPIDGVWEFNSTRAEAAKHTPPEDLVSENYGHYKFRFDRGSLYYTQAAEGAKRWTKASYTVKDHVLTFTVTAYGGEAPHGAAEKTGEVFAFHWSKFKDQLQLSKVPGQISPENFTNKPWRRIGDVR